MSSWLQRIRLSHNFLILGCIALLMVLLPLSLYVNTLVQAMQQAEREAQGMPPIMAVNAAVQRLQAHRGTTAGMLGGDATMAQRRPALRDAVSSLLAKAQQELQQADAPQDITQQLQQLVRTWQQLESAVSGRTITATQSMAQHTQLVNQLLQLNETLMHHYRLNVTPRADSQALMQALLS